jgi:protein-tyrosine phosphatase
VIGAKLLHALRALWTPPRQSETTRANAMVKVLFVCMGNICRSPMAEGAFRRMLEDFGLAEKVYADSAGTHSYHIGAPPDARGQATALRRGADLRRLRARQVTEADFAEFDYVLAMDRDNLDHLLALCRDPRLQSRIQLFLDYAPEMPEREVPDPYYGELGGFERVMDLVEAAAQGLLVRIRERYQI